VTMCQPPGAEDQRNRGVKVDHDEAFPKREDIIPWADDWRHTGGPTSKSQRGPAGCNVCYLPQTLGSVANLTYPGRWKKRIDVQMCLT